MHIFLYGTLLYEPILKQVCGLDLTGTLSAALPGFAVGHAADGPYPVLYADQYATAEGRLLTDVPEAAREAMDYYEEAFSYRRQSLEVTTDQGVVQADVYMPPANLSVSGPWDHASWAAAWGDISARAAWEAMSYKRTLSPQEMGAKFEQMRQRAAAYVAAQQGPTQDLVVGGPQLSAQDVTWHGHRRPYSAYFAVEEIDLSHKRFDGRQSPEMMRGAFIGWDAVIVLPYDPVRDRILVIEQIRMGPLLRGDPKPWLIEPVAGRIDAGETPEEAARREALEEAHLTLTHLEPVGAGYPTPGMSTEFFHLFVGLADLPDGVDTLAGLPAEHEDIRTHVLGFDEAIARADAGEVRLVPMMALLSWLDRHRARLQKLARATA